MTAPLYIIGGVACALLCVLVVVVVLLIALGVFRTPPQQKHKRGGSGDSNVTFHVLIATAGRPSLARLLHSLEPQLREGDAVTVVFDGAGARAKADCDFASDFTFRAGVTVTTTDQVPNLGSWGHGVRTAYQGKLTPGTTYIMHADDDDIYVHGAFDKLRALCVDPDTLYVARMRQPDGTIIPRTLHSFRVNDIGTPCGIVPWRIATKASWGPFVGGDGLYYEDVAKHARNGFKILDEVIYVVRPSAASD